MESLTTREAYTAMYFFLENLYRMTGSDELAGFLGGLAMLEDGTTADAAAWRDWLDAVAKVRAGRDDIRLRLKPPE
jgi:ribulose 1,5-bisphosphate carboxylase large subunit-like protein